MQVAHNEPNTAFSAIMMKAAHHDAVGVEHEGEGNEWIEIFHSCPSWKECQISYSTDDGKNWVPYGKYKLIDASDIREGFRSFRIRSSRFRFQLANSNESLKDTNDNKMYDIQSPGRYVVDSGCGCRRISDAQIADCLRPLRSNDSTIDIIYVSATWPQVFISYCCVTPHQSSHLSDSKSDSIASAWITLPLKKSATVGYPTNSWIISIHHAPLGIDCAFNDGASSWDSNNSINYQIRLPGVYSAGNGFLSYKGVSRLDLHISDG